MSAGRLCLLLVATALAAAAAAASAAPEHHHYRGYSLYEVTASSEEQVRAFSELEADLQLDVWRRATPSQPATVLVSPEQRQLFLQGLQRAGLTHAPQLLDVLQLLEEEERWIAEARNQSRSEDFGLNFDEFHRYDAVDAYLEELALRYPDTVTLVSGGTSFEGRDIKYLRISTTNFQDHSKPVVMLQSLMHAREWITLPATLYAIHKLVVDVTERDLVDDIDWIVVPIVNPDGYEYTHRSTAQRLWRKNRSTGHSFICTGVDLNRNFDFFWATDSSNSGCSDTFHGPSPFSESETSVVREIIDKYGPRIELFADIHSFGSYILYSYGHDGSLPPNVLQLHLLGVQMAQAIDAVKVPENNNFIVGNSALTLYSASGLASDYAQSKGVPLSYTYELPEYNRGTFIVNPIFIRQAAMETWEGLKVGARFAARSYTSRSRE